MHGNETHRRWCAAAPPLPLTRELAHVQRTIPSSRFREGFLGLSVTGTIRQCYKLGLKDAAARFAKEHRVPEKQAQLLALDATAAQHDWVGLQAKVGGWVGRS